MEEVDENLHMMHEIITARNFQNMRRRYSFTDNHMRALSSQH